MGSTPTARNQQDLLSSEICGVAATRINERMKAATGQITATPILFESSESVANAGVLLLLPYLKECGLLGYKRYYEELSTGYYYIDAIIVFLALMYLCRIKNIEQLKKHSPGELGKLVGLDRIPEEKCFRKKIREIVGQNKTTDWMTDLTQQWVEKEEPEFYYIDGHVQVYHGTKAILGKKHVSRQKLCMPGMQEFWVNNKEGLPYFYVTGVVNEKLLEVLSAQIVPRIKQIHGLLDKPSPSNESPPVFTIVFDREGYSPEYFGKLWEEQRVAVLTYRKNAYDPWPEEDFNTQKLTIEGVEVEMALAEKQVEINQVSFREVRKLGSNGHQTSVLTTNSIISTIMVAIYMFSRWSQENFFKYLRQNYDMDQIIQYAVDQIDCDFEVVNPEYSKVNNQIKKVREKISRRQAKLFKLQNQHSKDDKLTNTPKHIARQAAIQKELNDLGNTEIELICERKTHPYKVKVKHMAEEKRYSSLKLETKAFQNIIKMICYRAETALAGQLKNVSKKYIDEKRSIVKSLIQTTGNITPDYEKNILLISLYTQANPRTNKCLKHICETLNQFNTQYPGTNLVLKYELAT